MLNRTVEDRGGGGYRISAEEKTFQVHSDKRCKIYLNLEDVHRALGSSVEYRSHMIRRGIDSKTSDGRPL